MTTWTYTYISGLFVGVRVHVNFYNCLNSTKQIVFPVFHINLQLTPASPSNEKTFAFCDPVSQLHSVPNSYIQFPFCVDSDCNRSVGWPLIRQQIRECNPFRRDVMDSCYGILLL